PRRVRHAHGVRAGQPRVAVAADRGGGRRRRGGLGGARVVVGRARSAAREPYPLDRTDARASAGSRAGGAHVSFVSTAVQRVLEDGQFCAVAAATPNGPHCTPLVFAYSGARLWLTTSRGSVKARAWRVDRSVAGLIRHGVLSVAFVGTVKTYDALDRNTWGAAVAGATSIARATGRFSK